MKNLYFGALLIVLLFSYAGLKAKEFNRYDFIEWNKSEIEKSRKAGKKNVANNLIMIAGQYNEMGEYTKALDYFHQASQLLTSLEVQPLTKINFFDAIISFYLNTGDYLKALYCAHEHLKLSAWIYEQVNSGKNIGVGKDIAETLRMSSHTIVGLVYRATGDYLTAINNFLDALKYAKKVNKYAESMALYRIGLGYKDIKDFVRASNYFELALEMLELHVQKPGADFWSTKILRDMGDLFLDAGDIEKTKNAFKKIPDDRIRSGQLAKLSLATHEYKNAITYSEESLIKNKKYGDIFEIFLDYIRLGRSYEELKEFDTAQKYYQSAIDLIEYIRDTVIEGQLEQFFISRLEPYEGMVRTSYHLKRQHDLGLFYAEHTKSRTLSEILAKKRLKSNFNVTSDILSEENNLANKIAALSRQKQAALDKNNPKDYDKADKEIKELKAHQKKLISALYINNPEYASIKYPRPVKLQNIPLSNNEILLEFEVTDSATYLFVVQKGEIIKFIEIPVSRNELEEKIKNFRHTLENTTIVRYDPKIGEELYDLLLATALSEVSKNNHLIIVPDEILSILPFDALSFNTENMNNALKPVSEIDSNKQKSYLGDIYNISYYQSSTVLTINRTKSAYGKKWKSPFFGVGDPIFDEQDQRYQKMLIRTNESAENAISLIPPGNLRSLVNQFGYKFPRLPDTAYEIMDVARLYDEKANPPNIRLSMDANEQAIKNQDLTNYRYIHFATHGILGDEIPYIKEPALVLNQIGNINEDGFLTASEIMDIKLNGDLVVLSACKTGLGKMVSGEGIIGLSRAIMYAGTNSVIVSLWSVASKPTTVLMTNFYKYLKEGFNKTEALRLAKRELRKGFPMTKEDRGLIVIHSKKDDNIEKEIDTSHPFFWASFILYGE